jgi:hypothetical protein
LANGVFAPNLSDSAYIDDLFKYASESFKKGQTLKLEVVTTGSNESEEISELYQISGLENLIDKINTAIRALRQAFDIKATDKQKAIIDGLQKEYDELINKFFHLVKKSAEEKHLHNYEILALLYASQKSGVFRPEYDRPTLKLQLGFGRAFLEEIKESIQKVTEDILLYLEDGGFLEDKRSVIQEGQNAPYNDIFIDLEHNSINFNQDTAIFREGAIRRMWSLFTSNPGRKFSLADIYKSTKVQEWNHVKAKECKLQLIETKKNLIKKISSLGISSSEVRSWFVMEKSKTEEKWGILPIKG